MILSICQHHPTLLTILLDVCLSWNLIQESHILLRALLVASISPPNTSLPPISHPAHTSSLTDLCNTWTAAHSDQANAHRPFVRILIAVLTGTQACDVWTCKAITKLARDIHKKDFVSFVHIVTGLASTIGHKKPGNIAKNAGTPASVVVDATNERDRLNKWVITMLDYLWRNEDASPHVLAASAEGSSELQAIIAFLSQARLNRLHLLRAPSNVVQSELSDSIICLATCCFATISSNPSDSSDVQDLVNLLSETTPITPTFDELIALIFNDSAARCLSQNWSLDIMRKLRNQSAPLRSHSLLRLEASLWACALRYLERDTFAELPAQDELDVLRKQIIDAVDEAETRCFGSAVTGLSTSEFSKRRREKEGHPDGEWEWEEMVGCWIRRSPIAKKPRLENHSTISSRRVLRSMQPRRLESSSISTSPTLSASSWAAFSGSSTCTTPAMGNSDVDVDSEGDGYHPLTPGSRRPASNFTSILADAQVNRTMLHRKSTTILRHSLRASRVKRPPSSSVRKGVACEGVLVPAPDDSHLMLSSDDSLDLFACDESLPVTRL